MFYIYFENQDKVVTSEVPQWESQNYNFVPILFRKSHKLIKASHFCKKKKNLQLRYVLYPSQYEIIMTKTNYMEYFNS